MKRKVMAGVSQLALGALLMFGAFSAPTNGQESEPPPTAILICYDLASCGVPTPNCPSGVCWDGWIYDCYCGTGWVIGITCPCYG